MMEMINKKRNKKGFTLIELVVVIAILGILAAIAIPRLGGFRKSAGETADRTSAALIAKSAEVYAAGKNWDDDAKAKLVDPNDLIEPGLLTAEDLKPQSDIESEYVLEYDSDAGLYKVKLGTETLYPKEPTVD